MVNENFTKNKCISFSFRDRYCKLLGGESFVNSPENLFQDTSNDRLNTIIEKLYNSSPWLKVVSQEFEEENPWLHKIITSPLRKKFFDDFIKPDRLFVLDIGAGWGQITIPLAKSNRVCALEPNPNRLNFINLCSQQESVNNNISFVGADYLDIKFQTKFDLIISIGVLEWVGVFNREKNPQELQKLFLSKINSNLSQNGRLVIGIENRVGLKYLMGANDDHIGKPYISCYRSEISKKKYVEATNRELRCFTYTISEYKDLLLHAGFSSFEFYVALPDYKLPSQIFPISQDFINCDFNRFLMKNNFIPEYDGSNGRNLENNLEIESHYSSLAEMNIAHFFAPSFYIVAQ